MSVYRCTRCGSRIEVQEGVKVSTCPSCQALFVLPNQFAQKENLYLLAAEARLEGNYDMALNYYGRILKVDGAEPEANWGYLLSKYGVEISENALDYGGVLFHRVEHGSFTKDPAYEKMMTYVPRDSRYYYESVAREIDAQHRKLMAVSKTLTAPEIYINCTAKQGTEDYLLSVQVGKALEDAGYRIFHPGMLSKVERKDLNLYEMAAAEKAEAMIVVMTRSTDREDTRFQAVWNRFLAYRRNDAGRKMLSVFRGIRPEDLPLPLQPLQSIACEGSDFQKQVVSDINRMFGRTNRAPELVKKLLNLLREGKEALENKQFQKAEELFLEAVSLDGEEHRAHWGVVCARTANLTKPVLADEIDHHYRQALQFADKADARSYGESMEKLMSSCVWAELQRLTGHFSDYYCGGKADVQKAEERAKLYLPALDGRFRELEDWHKGIERQKELDALNRAYRNRDTAVEPLFAEQEKVEYAYEHTVLDRRDGLDACIGRSVILFLSLTAMVLSWGFLLKNFSYSKGYDSAYYKPSMYLFIVSLALIVFWAGRFLGKTWVYVVSGIGAFLLYRASRETIRLYQLYLMLLPIALLLVECFRMMVYAKNRNISVVTKQKAGQAVCDIERKIEASYLAAINRIYEKYSLPKQEAARIEIPHSGHYSGIGVMKKAAAPFSYPLRGILAVLALWLITTFVSNLIYTSGWKHVAEITGSWYHVLALKEDGTVRHAGRKWDGQHEVSDWEHVVAVGAGLSYSAGLTEDGRVLVASTDPDLLEAEEWTDIASITAGTHHLAGLRTDGTVVVAGSNGDGECETEEWTDAVQVLAIHDPDNGENITLGLKGDGSLLLTASGPWDQFKEQVNERFGPGEGQTAITELYGSTPSTLMRGNDGHFYGIGRDHGYQLSQAEEWNAEEITDVSISSTMVGLGIRTDGTVACAGTNMHAGEDVASWTDIKAVHVSGSSDHALGLREDGTVLATGKNNQHQLETEDWKDIKDIYAGAMVSYGIRENGKVEATGYGYGGLSYTQWKNPVELLQFWRGVLEW